MTGKKGARSKREEEMEERVEEETKEGVREGGDGWGKLKTGGEKVGRKLGSERKKGGRKEGKGLEGDEGKKEGR